MGEKNETRQRLRIVPELLPDPTPRDPGSSPRQRTLSHMQRLIALAAASTAVQAGCDRPDKGAAELPKSSAEAPPQPSTEVPPQPSVVISAAPSGSAPASSWEKPPPLPPTATAKPKITPPPRPPRGYLVVDPMPTPATVPTPTTLPPQGNNNKP